MVNKNLVFSYQNFFNLCSHRYFNLKKPKQIAKIFSGPRILVAVLFGMSVSIYLLFQDFDIENYKHLHWTTTSSFFIFFSLILMSIRDLAYMYRIRVLTDKKLNWKKSFQTIMLWEFSSALTPSVVGGSAVAFFIVSKELKNVGKATAIVMITALLDELFYIVMVPLMFIFIPYDSLIIEGNFKLFNLGQFPTGIIFLVGYSFILLLTTIISLAIFFRPIYFKNLLITIFSFRLLNRWVEAVAKVGDEIIITSVEMKGKGLGFWLKAIGATFASWTARFLVVNALILAFMAAGDQLMIFARQLVMWVILLISPTPGGSGVAEFMLPKFLGEYTGSFANEIALIWRLISYYAYLIIGAIVLPIWLRRIYKKKKKSKIYVVNQDNTITNEN